MTQQWRKNAKNKAMNYATQIEMEIRDYMEENSITQTELANECDISAGYISEVLQGEKVISLLTLAKLSEGLGIDWEFTMVKAGDNSKDLSNITPETIDESWLGEPS